MLVPEQLQDPLGVDVQRLLGAQERRLLVEGVTGPGHEDGRDAQRVPVGVLEDVGGAGDVPAGVAPGLERLSEATVGEARRIRLTLHQGLAGELRDGGAVRVGLEEAVVLLGRQAGERVEDVGVVGGALLDGPVLHGRRNDVGDGGVERFGVVEGVQERLVDRLRQSRLHHRPTEHVLPELLARGRLLLQGVTPRPVGGDGFDGRESGRATAHGMLRFVEG